MKPHIRLLAEKNTRTGFFEPHQLAAVLAHLPTHLQPVVRFAHITGWRVRSEVLGLEWRHVDFSVGEVRLDPHTTKNEQARTFPMTIELRGLLERQHAEHERLKKAGIIALWMFWETRGERGSRAHREASQRPRRIGSFDKRWKRACQAAGCPGRILHDFRRTAVRNLVRASIPERVAMQMTGHKTRSVFERYNIVSPGDLKDAARKLDTIAANSEQVSRSAGVSQ